MGEPPEILLRTRLFSVLRKRIPTRHGATAVRETIEHPGAVAILPLLDDGRVCLIHNRRAAVDETLIELPAGTLEPGEQPAETARRELIEETGYRCGSLEKLHEFYMSPGILSERMFLFLATDLVADERDLEPGEEIENLIVSWSEALAMADDGRIQDAKTLVGLFCYDRIRSRSRK